MLLTLLVSALEGDCWALVGEEEREDFGGGSWVCEEESGVEGCMRKRRSRHTVFGRRAEKLICRIVFVELHFANHWDSIGTWRKMSI
jgi:hypothetical protein